MRSIKVWCALALAASSAVADVELKTGSWIDAPSDFIVSENPRVNWIRRYSSRDAGGGLLGPGWTTRFEQRLVVTSPYYARIVDGMQSTLYVLKSRLDARDAKVRILLMTKGMTDLRKREQLMRVLQLGHETYDDFWAAYLNEHRVAVASVAAGTEYVGDALDEGVLRFEGTRAVLALPSGLERVFDGDGRLVELRQGKQSVRLTWKGEQLTKLETSAQDQFELVYSENRLRAIKRAGSGATVVAYQHDARGRLTGVTDAKGNRLQYAYDGQTSRITEIRSPTGTVQKLAYAETPQGARVSRYELGSGMKARFSYDFSKVARGTWVTRVERELALPKKGTTKASETHEWLINRGSSKDPYVFREVHQIGRDRAEIFRNELGQPTLEIVGNQKVLYRYDSIGRLLTRMTKDEVTQYRYGDHGQLVTIGTVGTRDPAKNTTATLAYDGHGQLTDFRSSDGMNATFVYDAGGRLTAMRDTARGVGLELEYDAASRLQAIESDRFGVFRFNRSDSGELRSMTVEGNAAKRAMLEYWLARLSLPLSIAARGGK